MLPTQAGSDSRPPLQAQALAGLETGGGVERIPKIRLLPTQKPRASPVQGGRSHLIGSCSHPGTCPGTSCPSWRFPECSSHELNTNWVGVKGEKGGGDTAGRGTRGRLAVLGAGFVGPFITAYLPLLLGPICPGPGQLGSLGTGE